MSKVAIATGADQGLGLALVRGRCRTLGTDGIAYLPARDRKRGEQAVGELEAEGPSPGLRWQRTRGLTRGWSGWRSVETGWRRASSWTR